MLKIFATIAVFVASVAAQTPPVSVTQPLQDFTVTAGQPYTIAWVSPTVNTISQIWLAQGPTTALIKIELIAQNVPATPLLYTWNVDAGITPGDYSLEIGNSPNVSYAGPFHIVAASASASASASAAGNSTSSATVAFNSTNSVSSVSSSSASVSTTSTVVSSASTTAAASSSAATTAISTTSSTSDAKMVAPMALLALVPIALSFF